MGENAWSFPEDHVACEPEPTYFDATPEGSVIFDWDVTVPDDAGAVSSPSMFVGNQGSTTATTAQRGVDEGNKKTRPPKLVREVRDLQEGFRQLCREVQSKVDSASLQQALEDKPSQQELDKALECKADQEDFRCLSGMLSDKVGAAKLENALQQTVSQHEFQDALGEKVSQELFQKLRHRMKGKLDATVGDVLQQGLKEKASQNDLQRLQFNVEGKADRSSVQAALSQKVSWTAMTWRMAACSTVWVFTVIICAVIFSCLFYLLLQQQQKLQQLAHLNEELRGTINRLDINHHQLNDTIKQFAVVQKMVTQLTAPDTLPSQLIGDSSGNREDGLQLDMNGDIMAHNQVFTSTRVHEDTYTVELVPPFSNAWLIVDASLGAAGIVCSGKADAILRAEHKIFSFYAPPAIEDDKSTPAIAASQQFAITPLHDRAPVITTTTTTTTKPRVPCMIMTTSLKESQGGSLVVFINFKRDPESLDGTNSSRIYNVSGKIQWFPQ